MTCFQEPPPPRPSGGREAALQPGGDPPLGLSVTGSVPQRSPPPPPLCWRLSRGSHLGLLCESIVKQLRSCEFRYYLALLYKPLQNAPRRRFPNPDPGINFTGAAPLRPAAAHSAGAGLNKLLAM